MKIERVLSVGRMYTHEKGGDHTSHIRGVERVSLLKICEGKCQR